MSEFVVQIFVILVVVVVVAFASMAVAYSILMRRITQKLQHTVEEMEDLLAVKLEAAKFELERAHQSSNGVPPMCVHWENAKDNVWLFGTLGERIHRWMVERDFAYAGQFVIEEMDGELVRAYVEEMSRVIACVRLPSDARECYVEFCFHLGDGELGGVSNPPGATVPLPQEAIGRFYSVELSKDFGLINRMYIEAAELAKQHSAVEVPVDGIAVAELFERAHAEEMDFRLQQGGLTRQEIRNAFIRDGELASEADIDRIQHQWQDSIERHLLDFSTRGQNFLHSGRSVLVVHDGSSHSYVQQRITARLEETLAAGKGSAQMELDPQVELRVLLNRFTPREAVARFRPLLPQPLRFDLIDQLDRPIEADLYVLP